MAKTKPSRPEVTGPFAEYAPGFRAELARLGYTPLSAACQMRLMAHLSRWMTAEGLSTRVLDMPTAERYFAVRRLGGIRERADRRGSGPAAGLPARARAGPLPPTVLSTETARLLDRFAAYLAALL